MKEIIRDGKKFYELKEQDLIRLHTRMRLIYECVDNIFMNYEDFDPSTIAALADIKNQVMEARDILKVTEGHYTIKKSSVEMSEDEWKKIRGGAMSYGDVEQRLEDAIADVDCTLSDRIDELEEKIAEMYDFYDNFPSDWTLEKQLKELAEETVKNAIEPIMKRQTLLKMDIDSLRNDLKLWVSNDERTSTTTEDRLSKLEKTVATLSLNVNNANVTANVACNNPRIEKLEKELNGVNAVQGGHRLELDGLNRKLDQIRVDVNKNRRALTELRDKEYMSTTLEETSDESMEDRLDKLEKAFDVMSAVCPKYHK